MGYDTRLYFVERHDRAPGDPCDYGSIIAMLEMGCLASTVLNLIESKRPEKPAIYIFNENRKVKRDAYDSPLSVLDPAELLKAMRYDHKRGRIPYRRLVAAIALLDALIAGDYHNLTVLAYGH